jgi:hypothetical protein
VKKAFLLLTALAVAVGGAIIFLGRPQGTTTVQRTTRGAPEIFDEGGLVAGGAAKAYFNGTGTRLVLVSSEGVGVVEEGEIDIITPPQAQIAEATWLTGTTDIAVVQAPVADRIAIINADGNETGFVPLQPSVEVGSGHGLAIDTARRRAILGVERRPSLEPAQRYLVSIDLRSGAVTELTPPGGPDEVGPFFLDDSTIIFTRLTDGEPEMIRRDLDGSGAERTDAVDAQAVGVVGEIPVFVSGSAVAAGGSDPQVLYRLQEGESVAAVDPSGGRLALLERTPTGTRIRSREIPRPEPGV